MSAIHVAEPHPYVVAVDPGTHRCGVALFRGPLLHSETLTLPLSRRIVPLARTCLLVERVIEIADTWRDEIDEAHLVYEMPGHFSSEPRPIIPLHQFVGALHYAAWKRKYMVVGYPVSAVKLGVAGRANASKAEVEAILRHEFNLHDQRLASDQWDAIAVGVYHLAQLRIRRAII